VTEFLAYLPQLENHFAVTQVALALANLCHVGDGTRRRAELRGVAAPSIPNLIVAGHAGDVRSPDPQALHEGSPSPQSRHMPSQVTFRPIYLCQGSELKINPLKNKARCSQAVQA
jgi:hypothetical protein